MVTIKAVIWDLDETLWHGTIYHNDKVVLKAETKEVLKQLNKLGVIQIVCTHNTQENAIATLTSLVDIHIFEAIFASISEEKDSMIKQILESYNLKPEEVIFIDDTPLNRVLARENVGVNVDYMEDLYEVMKYFDTDRLITMNQQRIRVTAEKQWTGSRKEFLAKVGNTITISKPTTKQEKERITILANRTNELNATFNRYSMKQIESFIKDKNYIVNVAYLKDKYGDYGLVGEIILRKDDDYLFIEEICVSCRSMGRGVGKKLLEVAKDIANKNDKTLKGVVVKNKDNYRMPKLFESVGLTKISEDKKLIWYES